MSSLGLLAALFLTLGALVITAYPLLWPVRENSAAQRSLERQIERVQRYYGRVLTNIRDLDEDFATGKISRAAHHSEREVWVQRGVRLLRVQDRLIEEQGLADASAADAERIDRAIEAAVRAVRAEADSVQGAGEGG